MKFSFGRLWARHPLFLKNSLTLGLGTNETVLTVLHWNSGVAWFLCGAELVLGLALLCIATGSIKSDWNKAFRPKCWWDVSSEIDRGAVIDFCYQKKIPLVINNGGRIRAGFLSAEELTLVKLSL